MKQAVLLLILVGGLANTAIADPTQCSSPFSSALPDRPSSTQLNQYFQSLPQDPDFETIQGMAPWLVTQALTHWDVLRFGTSTKNLANVLVLWARKLQTEMKPSSVQSPDFPKALVAMYQMVQFMWLAELKNAPDQEPTNSATRDDLFLKLEDSLKRKNAFEIHKNIMALVIYWARHPAEPFSLEEPIRKAILKFTPPGMVTFSVVWAAFHLKSFGSADGWVNEVSQQVPTNEIRWILDDLPEAALQTMHQNPLGSTQDRDNYSKLLFFFLKQALTSPETESAIGAAANAYRWAFGPKT